MTLKQILFYEMKLSFIQKNFMWWLFCWVLSHTLPHWLLRTFIWNGIFISFYRWNAGSLSKPVQGQWWAQWWAGIQSQVFPYHISAFSFLVPLSLFYLPLWFLKIFGRICPFPVSQLTEKWPRISLLVCTVRKESQLFFKRFYLFLERWKGRTERERNINVQLPPTHPHLGTWPATQACALTGNWTGDSLVHRPALNPLSYTSQGRNHNSLMETRRA